MASLEGGLCFQKGLGAVHALSHVLGSLKAPVLHHGTLNGILLPAILRFNEDSCFEKYARIRSALRLSQGRDLADVMADLQHKIGLPARLSELGVDQDILPRLAREAMRDLSHATNPRTPDEDDYLQLLRDSF